MPYLSYCNIAFGGPIGNDESVVKTIDAALEFDVKIGAHPSFPDRFNFGRKHMNFSFTALVDSLSEQIALVEKVTEKLGGVLHHIKPHDALYHAICVDKKFANAFLDSLKNVVKSSIVITANNSKFIDICKSDFMVEREFFLDRNYNSYMSLMSRVLPKSVLVEPSQIVARAKNVFKKHQLKTIDGGVQEVCWDTICVHGDHPNLKKIITALFRFMEKENLEFS